jgi:hypothetical protein
MTAMFQEEVEDIQKLQQHIGRRLTELQFLDQEARGEIVHHLAEVAVLGRKVAEISLKQFLSLPVREGEKLAELVVDIQTDLDEVREAISDMEASLLKLVNFLNP